MRVAIVHDYIKEYGGAERVLEALHEIFPDAIIYTSVYLPEFLGPHKERFKKMNIKPSFLQYIPFKEKLISPFRIISPLVFKSFNFEGYDLVIVSQTGAYFPNFVNKGKAKLVCYTHTPPRYLYGYATARQWKNNVVLRILGEAANHFLRVLDFESSQKVDYFLANSNEVSRRIKKFYRRDATVIYPPVGINPNIEIRNPEQIQNTKYKIPDTKYYLSGGRLARAKGTDIIVKAFGKLGKPLKVFGRGFAGYEKELKVQSSKCKVNNVKFLGEVTEEEKSELMKGARAFVFASFDEDFGITPVEAMAQGTPVIAYKSGGVKETVVDGKTGIFYENNTPESLVNAVKRFEKRKFKSSDCIKQARNFSKQNFKKEILKFVNQILQ